MTYSWTYPKWFPKNGLSTKVKPRNIPLIHSSLYYPIHVYKFKSINKPNADLIRWHEGSYFTKYQLNNPLFITIQSFLITHPHIGNFSKFTTRINKRTSDVGIFFESRLLE